MQINVQKDQGIKVIKLISGEELIGEINDFQTVSPTFTIKKPLKVTIARGPDGMPGKMLIDFYLLCPEVSEVTMYKSSLVSLPLDAPKETADAWIQQTSGIVLATQLNG